MTISRITCDFVRRGRPALHGRGLLGASLIIAVLLGSSAAFAQPAKKDSLAAEALFAEAHRLVQAGDYAAGCPKFEASLALYPSASTMINIARCHEHDGKIATAWQDHRRALALNSETQGAERRKGLLEIATKGINDLTPRLPKLRIVISGAPAGLLVARDGQELPAAALGEALPADPGQHEVRVSAPGYRAETRSVTLEEGKTATVELTLKPGDPVDSASKRPDAAPARGFFLPAGIVSLAVGAVGLGIGAATGIASLKKVSDVKARCGGAHCLSTDTADQREVGSAMTLGTQSTASFIAGGVLTAAGAVFLVLHHGARSKSAPDATPAASLGVSVGLGQVTFQRRF